MTTTSEKTAAGAPLMSFCGGHPALDFVNSLDNRFRPEARVELLPTYAELLRFLEESGLLNAEAVGALRANARPASRQSALEAALELRETAASILYAHAGGTAPPQAALHRLEKYVLAASQHRELRWESNASRLEWTWGRHATDAALPVWVLAQSIAELLLDGPRLARVRTCAADTCRWLFLDTSKNHTRRWCDMKVCGNRMKARRFQARHES